MAKPITQLADLQEHSFTSKSIFRVIRKYHRSDDRGEFVWFELLVEDEKGTRMNVSVNGNNVVKFDPVLKEGDVVSVENFHVMRASSIFPFVKYPGKKPLKIVINHDTEIVHLLGVEFSGEIFRFRNFLDINAEPKGEDSPLYDVIGNVVGFEVSGWKGELDMINIDVLIEDEEKNKLLCTLWPPHSDEFDIGIDASIIGHEYFGIIIQHCRSSLLFAGVESDEWATKIIIDQGHPEIIKFINKISSASANNG